MKTAVILCLSLLVLSVYSKIETEDEVLILTDANFEEALKTYDNILVEIYAPWCGHCQKLAPEYAKAAQRLAKEDSPIKLAKVDGTQNLEVNDKHISRGYPTIKFFQKGKPKDYTGKRDRNAIVEWVKKETGVALKVLKTLDDVKEFKAKSDITLIGYYENEKASKNFQKLALTVPDIPVGVVYDKSVALSALKLNAQGIVLNKASDDEIIPYEERRGGWTEWLEKNRKPLVNEFTQSDASTIFGGEQKEFIVLFYKESDGIDKIKKDFRKAAKQFKGTVQFVQVDVLVETNDRIGDFFGINPEDIPTIRALSRKSGLNKYKQSKPKLSSSDILKFAEDFKADKLKPYLKSQDIPEDWDKGLITTLVGKNFNEIAKDSAKHVIVKFYAPWCAHCQNLVPAWDKLGELYKDNENVVIAKMEATLNEVEGITIRALPTISLWKKGDGPNVDYTGELNLKEIVEFLVKETGEEPNGEVVEPSFGEEGSEAQSDEAKESSEGSDKSGDKEDKKEAYKDKEDKPEKKSDDKNESSEEENEDSSENSEETETKDEL